MKALEFIYQDTQIHFLINPLDSNVMINATEMAKAFGKETRVFLKSDHAKAFISELNLTLNGGQIIDKRAPNGAQIIDDRGRNGIFFERRLALKFAAWLDVKFELWIFSAIDEILFGHYKKHWEAHAMQEQSKLEMEAIKKKLLIEPTPELVVYYFEQERNVNNAKRLKSEAIRNQLNLFKQ